MNQDGEGRASSAVAVQHSNDTWQGLSHNNLVGPSSTVPVSDPYSAPDQPNEPTMTLDNQAEQTLDHARSMETQAAQHVSKGQSRSPDTRSPRPSFSTPSPRRSPFAAEQEPSQALHDSNPSPALSGILQQAASTPLEEQAGGYLGASPSHAPSALTPSTQAPFAAQPETGGLQHHLSKSSSKSSRTQLPLGAMSGGLPGSGNVSGDITPQRPPSRQLLRHASGCPSPKPNVTTCSHSSPQPGPVLTPDQSPEASHAQASGSSLPRQRSVAPPGLASDKPRRAVSQSLRRSPSSESSADSQPQRRSAVRPAQQQQQQSVGAAQHQADTPPAAAAASPQLSGQDLAGQPHAGRPWERDHEQLVIRALRDLGMQDTRITSLMQDIAQVCITQCVHQLGKQPCVFVLGAVHQADCLSACAVLLRGLVCPMQACLALPKTYWRPRAEGTAPFKPGESAATLPPTHCAFYGQQLDSIHEWAQLTCT